MKLTTNDELLDDELQELYILSSHWISDLNFAEGEIRFLNGIIQTFFLPGIEKDDALKMEAFGNRLAELGTVINALKVNSPALLKTIGPLIGRKRPKISLAFLEEFSTRENEIKQTAKEVKNIKTKLFDLVEKLLKRLQANTGQADKSEN